MSWWLRVLWTAAIGLVATTLGLTFLRLLEMPVEVVFDARLRVRLNSDLYPHLTDASGFIEVLAIVVAVVLAAGERSTNRFRSTWNSCVMRRTGRNRRLMSRPGLTWRAVGER